MHNFRGSLPPGKILADNVNGCKNPPANNLHAVIRENTDAKLYSKWPIAHKTGHLWLETIHELLQHHVKVYAMVYALRSGLRQACIY